MLFSLARFIQSAQSAARSPLLAARSLLLAAALMPAAGPLWSQCSMCKQTASYQKESAIEALNQGIILLAIPPAVILGGLVWLTYRHRDGYRPRQ